MIENTQDRNEPLIAPPADKETVQLVLVVNHVARGPNLATGMVGVTESGACLLLTAELPVNQEVLLTFDNLPRHPPVCLLGNVAWCQPIGAQWMVAIRLSGAAWLPDFIKKLGETAA